jgi:hypothetical protein
MKYRLTRYPVLAAFVVLTLTTSPQAQEQPFDLVKIKVDLKMVLAPISSNFIGVGYETSAVAQSSFFSPKNLAMIQLYKNLSPRGLIRIGGIISDHTKYEPDGTPAARTMKEVTVINKASLTDLGAFAQATGWKVMWGLNLGTGSKDEAVQEALAVNATLGTNLQSFEIGNEVEALKRFAGNYETYHSAFLDYKSGLRAALPNAPFSGPDVIGNLQWITNFVAAEAGDMKLLTQHYYRGDAHDPKTTLEKLLQHDSGWDRRLAKLREIGREHALGYRINEVNSFSSGGKAGVSDTFGAALWCLDYMFILALHGCDGVNMETDVNQLGFISHYSPIVHDKTVHCSARPEYYGMLAFALAGNGELLNLADSKTQTNLSIYAARHADDSIWITVINKDFARDADVESILPEGYARSQAIWLRAPSMTSTNQVTLAEAEVAWDGTWTPKPADNIPVTNGVVRMSVPHASALLLELRHY